jgi:hypothetical protein
MVLFVLDISRVFAALQSFQLQRRPVYISAADELVFDSFQVKEPVVELCGEDGSCEVSEMRDAMNIR